jgi:hypothetical protein
VVAAAAASPQVTGSIEAYVMRSEHVDGSGPLAWSDRTADAPESLPGPVGLDPRLTMFRDLFPRLAASLVRALAADLVGGDAIAALLRP